MLNKRTIWPVYLTLIVALLAISAAGDDVSVSTSVDFYNRYVWRGMDIATTPSIQPTVALDCGGLEFGIWGAYTLSNQASESDEIDFWLSYTATLNGGVSITGIATDYYYPNHGIRFFNFNNYDATIDDTVSDPGAHLIELGLSVSGPEAFPATVAGYINVYNDAGSNTYFQVDYPVTVNETALNLFCGVAGGSKDNPGYYGTDNLQAINMGVTASREIAVSESFSMPLNVSFIVNPKEEMSYLVVGLSF